MGRIWWQWHRNDEGEGEFFFADTINEVFISPLVLLLLLLLLTSQREPRFYDNARFYLLSFLCVHACLKKDANYFIFSSQLNF